MQRAVILNAPLKTVVKFENVRAQVARQNPRTIARKTAKKNAIIVTRNTGKQPIKRAVPLSNAWRHSLKHCRQHQGLEIALVKI
jgi:hypothetical protein